MPPIQDFGDLDEAQVAAVRTALGQRISLIQGRWCFFVLYCCLSLRLACDANLPDAGG
jgi:hypothetical protein